MKALIIVDVQNDFLPGGALPVHEGDEIIDIINNIQKKFDLIVATKDWHPSFHKSFAITHGKKVGDVIKLRGVTQILWPVHCVQNSYGSEFPKKLHIEKVAAIFYKGSDENIDSYSTFFDNAHMRSTGLFEYLKERGIDEIYIVGLATDYCIKYSVLDARALGFKVNVIIEGCRGINLSEGDVEKAINEMIAAGAAIIRVEKI